MRCGLFHFKVMLVGVAFTICGLLGEAGNWDKYGIVLKVTVGSKLGSATCKEADQTACPDRLLTWQVYRPLSESVKSREEKQFLCLRKHTNKSYQDYLI